MDKEQFKKLLIQVLAELEEEGNPEKKPEKFDIHEELAKAGFGISKEESESFITDEDITGEPITDITQFSGHFAGRRVKAMTSQELARKFK